MHNNGRTHRLRGGRPIVGGRRRTSPNRPPLSKEEETSMAFFSSSRDAIRRDGWKKGSLSDSRTPSYPQKAPGPRFGEILAQANKQASKQARTFRGRRGPSGSHRRLPYVDKTLPLWKFPPSRHRASSENLRSLFSGSGLTPARHRTNPASPSPSSLENRHTPPERCQTDPSLPDDHALPKDRTPCGTILSQKQ